MNTGVDQLGDSIWHREGTGQTKAIRSPQVILNGTVCSTWALESGDMSVSLDSPPVFIFPTPKRQQQSLPHRAIIILKWDPAFTQEAFIERLLLPTMYLPDSRLDAGWE